MNNKSFAFPKYPNKKTQGINLLLVRDQHLPSEFFNKLIQEKFYLYFSRGPLKTKKILYQKAIDCIVWYWNIDSVSLIRDLLYVFNQFPKIPVVVLSENICPDFLEKEINNYFSSIHLQDSIQDNIQHIKNACDHHRILRKTHRTKQNDLNTNPNQKFQKGNKDKYLVLKTPWNMVNQEERNMLYESIHDSDRISWVTKFYQRIRALF